MRVRIWWELLKDTFRAWNEDSVPRLGAALAYYALFSIAPLLLILIGIAGLVFGERAAEGEIAIEMETALGRPMAEATQEILKSARSAGNGVAVTIVGGVSLFLGASGVFLQLQNALNTIWKVAPPPGKGFLRFLWNRLLSFLAVLAAGCLALLSLTVSTTLAAIAKFLTPAEFPLGASLWSAVENVTSFGLLFALFAMIFKFLPDTAIKWSEVWMGAAVTALLFTVGKFLLSLYLAYTSTASAFGAAGSLVVVLVWVYYSSQILLFGAELTRVFADHSRSDESGHPEQRA